MRVIKISTGILLLLISIASYAYAQMSESQAYVQFIKGGELYKRGEYARAVEVYEGILSGGQENGALYYNLGNTYFKIGNLGKAIISYERAKQLVPRDGDLISNANYALSLVKNNTTSLEKSIVQKAIDNHVTFYALNEMTIIISVLFAMMGAVVLLSLYFSWPHHLRNFSFTLLGALFFVYAFGLFVKVEDQNDRGIVMIYTEAKFEPSQDSTTHFKLPEGVEIKVLKTQGDWSKVKRSDGNLGWVQSKDVEKI